MIISRIKLFSRIVFLGLSFACAFHYAMQTFLDLSYPWDTFLFDQNDRFNDWHNSVFASKTMDPYYSNGTAIAAYFPFTYYLLNFISGFSKETSLLIYILFSAGLLLLGLVIFWDCLIKNQLSEKDQKYKFLLISSVFLCYPTIFALDRGNLDIWISALVLIFISTLLTPINLIGFFCLSIAISLKGYPAIFLLLSINQKKYFQTFATIFFSIILTGWALLHFDDGFSHNLNGFIHGLKAYRDVYVLGNGSIHFSSDPYNGLRLFIMGLSSSELSETSKINLLFFYHIFSYLLLISTVVFVLSTNLNFWKRVMAVCICAILFPDVANDYKLLILIPGLLVMIASNENKKNMSYTFFYVSALMLPKSYFFFKGISISGVINPVIMMLLIFEVFISDREIFYPLKNKLGKI